MPVPAVLLELGYLTNESEAAKLRDPKEQTKIAETIYASLLEIRSSGKN